MPQIRVEILAALRRFTNDKAELEIEGDTVGRVLGAIAEEYPGLGNQIFDSSGAVRDFMNVFLNEQNIRDLDGLETKTNVGDNVIIVPAIAGGWRA